jgi:hypothetical protein
VATKAGDGTDTYPTSIDSFPLTSHRIFIIEGLATIVMSVVCYYFLPDSPEIAAGRWLTHDEARFLQLTHIYTRGLQKKPEMDEVTGKAKFQWYVVWQVVTDWQLYLASLVFASNAVPN